MSQRCTVNIQNVQALLDFATFSVDSAPMHFLVCILAAWAVHVRGGKKGQSLASSFAAILDNPGQLEDPVAGILVEEDEPALVEVETEMASGEHGALSHIKVSSVAVASVRVPSALQRAVAATRAIAKKRAAQKAEAEQTLQTRLTSPESGAELDLDTPGDGHCLFWALQRGGLESELGDLRLTIAELRVMALSVATEEELEVAAASTEDKLQDKK